MAVVTGIEFQEMSGCYRTPLRLKIKYAVYTEEEEELEWKIGLALEEDAQIYTKLRSLKVSARKIGWFTLNFNLQLPEHFLAAEKRIRGTHVLLINGECKEDTFYQNFVNINVFYEEPVMELMPPPWPAYEKMVWKVMQAGAGFDEKYDQFKDVYIARNYLLINIRRGFMN